jgi:hypothetical protein
MTEATREYRVLDVFGAQARRQRTMTLVLTAVMLLAAGWSLALGSAASYWASGLIVVAALVQASEPIYSWLRARRCRVILDEHSLRLVGPGIDQRIELAEVRMARIHDDSAGKPRGLHLFPALNRDFELGPVEALDAIVARVCEQVPAERVLRVRW